MDIPDDDNGMGYKLIGYELDLLNDCLDQIYDFFQDDIEFDEDTVVEFLRSKGYDVQEAIDFIMEAGALKQPTPPPVVSSYSPVTTSNYTLPASAFTYVYDLISRYSCFCDRKESAYALSSFKSSSKQDIYL